MTKEEKKEYDRRYYQDHKEKISKQHKQYSQTHKEESRQYRQTHREKARECWLQYKYRISENDMFTMWNNQKGKCAICGEDFTKRSNAHVDHCHETGKVRGLLCVKCNMGIGQFNDSPKILNNAIKYLKGEKNDFDQ